MVTVHFVARSHPGLVRDHNEDSHAESTRLLMVADGVGGEAAGEVASALAVAAFTALTDPGTTIDDPAGRLRDAMAAANHSIADSVREHPEQHGMATTATVLFFGEDVHLAHVGDSRAYRWRGGELTRLSRDDSYVQDLVDEGALDPEEVAWHPYRSVVTKVLQGHPVEVAVTKWRPEPGDRYLVCSDGLTDYVSEEIVAGMLSSGDDPAAVADGLVAATLAAGAPDNVTVLLGDVEH